MSTVARIELREVDELTARVGGGRHDVIALLQAVQEKYQYLPREALERIAATTEITPEQLVGVASFYAQFRFTPLGKHRIRVCHGTACHVKGSGLIHDAIYRHLGIADGEDTDAERRFTVEKVACLGCCTLAPVVQIDDVVYGYLQPERVPGVLADFLRGGRRGVRADRGADAAVRREDGEIRVGLGSCCMAKGSDGLFLALRDELARRGARVEVKRVGCVGMCFETPLVEVRQPSREPQFYAKVGPAEARAIVDRHFPPRGWLARVRHSMAQAFARVFDDEAWEPVERYGIDVREGHVARFLDRQAHLATEECGSLDPFNLDEYRGHEGFRALEHCLAERTSESVIGEITRSGLRGRGGAGYPSGSKWAKVRGTPGERKFVICNGDEGDPGAFMDRMLLESFPFRVIEGMLIAAHAVGAGEGILYVRAEYSLALRTLREAIRICRERGMLGRNILGRGLDFELRIVEGAGAFVSGEETALLAALEGRRSMPRLRPPYPAEQGLLGQPTLISNVETFALVPWILRHGAGAFSAIGSAESKGTKVFALAGKVANGGLIEVPMGTTLREVVEEIGGGVADGRRLKAVQIGGPSGGCVPARHADTPIDFESLGAVGAIMGSGGLVVLDDRDCMVDIARYFMEFTQRESCGKCTYCRIGSKRMLEILTRLCEGGAKSGDLEQLERLGELMRKSSFCGLGKTSPNPVLTSMRYFREEYEAHLAGRCPAGRCKALIAYSITPECVGCTLCAQHCPVGAIAGAPYQVHEIDPDKCIRCDMCRSVCPESVVRVE